MRGCGDGRLYGGAARFRHDARGAACAGGAVRRPDQPAGEHRRGASRRCDPESGHPDNSLAGLKYALDLKVYAVECDIYATADNRVIMAHATQGCLVNGLKPWEHTYDELCAAGTLSNGERLPLLEDFLEEVMRAGNVETVARREEHPRRRFVGGLYGLLGAFVPAGLSGDRADEGAQFRGIHRYEQ